MTAALAVVLVLLVVVNVWVPLGPRRAHVVTGPVAALVRSGPGARAAPVGSWARFGIWHVLPPLDVTRTSTAIRGRGSLAERRRVLLTVLGTVLFTAVAGVVFAELRRRSGSLVAPLG